MGMVMRKIDLDKTYKPVLFGIDMNEDTVRFYHMGHYYEYPHLIGAGDDEWHFISCTY